MNLLLLLPSDLLDANTARITGRRYDHINKVLKANVGDELTAGWLNGKIGKATISAITTQHVTLNVTGLNDPPPPTLPVKLILGLPRPRMLHRLLQTVATLGVQELHLLQTARVEKSYWQTPLLAPEAVQEQLYLGLEQAKATQLPKVYSHKRFVPFMEDVLPETIKDCYGVIAHPGVSRLAAKPAVATTVLVIGPEGGFLTQEVQRFLDLGFNPLDLGPRILKVETAVPYALATLFS